MIRVPLEAVQLRGVQEHSSKYEYLPRVTSNVMERGSRYADFMNTIKVFEAQMRHLERLALPDSKERTLFEQEMRVADESGMNYREALEHVIRIRNGGSD